MADQESRNNWTYPLCRPEILRGFPDLRGGDGGGDTSDLIDKLKKGGGILKGKYKGGCYEFEYEFTPGGELQNLRDILRDPIHPIKEIDLKFEGTITF